MTLVQMQAVILLHLVPCISLLVEAGRRLTGASLRAPALSPYLPADFAVMDPDWPALEAALRARLPSYSMRRLTPSEDPTATILRVYCPLGKQRPPLLCK